MRKDIILYPSKTEGLSDKMLNIYNQFSHTPARLFYFSHRSKHVNCDDDAYPFLKIALILKEEHDD
jgi:hypothetical protein